LKLTDRDCPNLVALMNRIRALACTQRATSFLVPSIEVVNCFYGTRFI